MTDAGVRTVIVEVRRGMTSVALRHLTSDLVAAARGHRGVLCLVHDADLTVVDAMARVELVRRHYGLRCRIRAARPGELADLLELCGLPWIAQRLEVLGEAEPPEQ